MKLLNLKKIMPLAFIGFAAMGVMGCAGNYYEGPISDHFDGTRFFNPNAPEPESRGFLSFLEWRFTRDPIAWPESVPLAKTDIPPLKVNGSALRISNVGHASLLIQTRGINILTDPVWSQRASPFSFIGPKRIKAPGIAFDDLPPIDVVFVSHNHYDHLDVKSLQRLWRQFQPRIIVPLGNDTIIKAYDSDIEVEAYDWWDQTPLSNDLMLHLVPKQHWSARGLRDRNKALWSGFVIESPDGPVYFAGDLGFGDGSQFETLRAKFGEMRFSAIPTGAFQPRWFMEYSHMNPAEAVQAYQILNGKYAHAIHHGVFPLGDDGPVEADMALFSALEAAEISQDLFRSLPVGDFWLIED
ncbi:MAG: MBL fold metallo-hydrolase [Alphaproteobacteria bacterium]